MGQVHVRQMRGSFRAGILAAVTGGARANSGAALQENVIARGEQALADPKVATREFLANATAQSDSAIVLRGTVPYQGARTAKDAADGFARSVLARSAQLGMKPPRMSSAIVDTATSEARFGVSGSPLAGRVSSNFAAREPAQSLTRWPTRNCAEVKPTNEFDFQGVARSQLEGHTVVTKTLEPRECCPNCRLTTEGINWTSAGTQ